MSSRGSIDPREAATGRDVTIAWFFHEFAEKAGRLHAAWIVVTKRRPQLNSSGTGELVTQESKPELTP
jgi:hypothetical protein